MVSTERGLLDIDLLDFFILDDQVLNPIGGFSIESSDMWFGENRRHMPEGQRVFNWGKK